jgi:hypothetical protein
MTLFLTLTSFSYWHFSSLQTFGPFSLTELDLSLSTNFGILLPCYFVFLLLLSLNFLSLQVYFTWRVSMLLIALDNVSPNAPQLNKSGH